jgi:hypothetical protein
MSAGSDEPFATFWGLRKFPWVFPPLVYETPEALIAQLQDKIITPARQEAENLAVRKAQVEQQRQEWTREPV